METQEIINQLRQELHRIDSALAALDGTRGGIHRAATKGRPRGKRRHSASAKKRLSDAARRRWAAVKRAGKNRL